MMHTTQTAPTTFPQVVTGADAAKIADSTSDAFSVDRFKNWRGCAIALAGRGFTAREIEAILRSKHMRWAGDGYEGHGKVPTSALLTYLDHYGRDLTPGSTEATELVLGTFGA